MFHQSYFPIRLPFALLMACTLVGCATVEELGTIRDTAGPLGDSRISYPADRPADRDEQDARASGRIDDPRRDDAADGERPPKNEIPSNAVQLREWKDDQLAYEAPAAGFIYLFDESDNRIVYSGRLHPGERFTLDRAANHATINGVVVYTQNRTTPGAYKVYFDRD